MENLTFDLPINKSNLIKVVGVGGGGSNAINYMYNQGINGVDFVVCNTDSQALQNSPVPNKIQLGVTLTEGLGAGADPERGAQAALESIDEINQMLNINTKMVFIAAGMGGGTGTGAAPIIGKLAKDLGILTVGIVTIPFQFEGKTRNVQAQDGIKKLRNNVDSLIVINNNKLRDVYGDLGFKKGFAKADEVLTKAAKGIAEVITNHYTQNIDLKDAKTVLENSGTAIMGSGSSSGDNRAKKAVELALDSPLLNDNRILGSKNVLLLIVSGEDEATIDEINTINELIQSEAGSTNIIMGLGEDINLQNEISVTIIATGFAPDLQQDIIHSEPQKIIHSLDDEQQLQHELGSGQIQMFDSSLMNRDENIERKFEDYIPTSDDIKSIETDCEIVQDETSVKINEVDNFVVNDISDAVNDIEVLDYEVVIAENSDSLSIVDFPLQQNLKEQKVLFHLNKDEKIVDQKDEQENIKRYELKLEEEDEKNENKNLKEELNKFSPINNSIAEGLARRKEERKNKLVEFNYRFNKNLKTEELEREPAYKRQKVDFNSEENDSSISNTTIGEDSSKTDVLRTNNSFLHDNVD
ncbi:MAG: cell division protein FtsZ [Bacteroidota bacterium]|nr:cell division protein FtsZ [Bacteroidota bacterium]MEC8364187.1 cell division protein FtsZ [Bacteroidota bacterium]